MTTDGIYRSDAGERRIKGLYREMLSDLDMSIERRWAETCIGDTHVLTAGAADGRPLIILHGGNSLNPFTLSWFASLTDEYRLYAPDIVGQPGLSAQRRLPIDDDRYGHWIVDLLEWFEEERASIIGVSMGCLPLVRTLVVAPSQVERAACIVPAGFGLAPLRQVIPQVLLPVLLYRFFPRRRHLERALEPIFTEQITDVDPRTLEMIGAILRHTEIDTRPLKGIAEGERIDPSTPMFVAVAERDVFFPPETVIPTVRSTFTSLEVLMRLKGESHIPKPAARDKLIHYLDAFLAE